MGLQTLPNGIEYFSLSEELEQFTKIIYSTVTTVNAGIFLLVTAIFIAMVWFMVFYLAKKQIEAAT